jgi:hypothetical protein
VKYKDLEFRQTDGRDPEIVATKPCCFTILWWKRDKEGWYIEFVGARPLDQDMNDVWNLMRYGQAVLDAQFRLEEAC